MSGCTSAHKLSSIDPASCFLRGSIDRRACATYTYRKSKRYWKKPFSPRFKAGCRRRIGQRRGNGAGGRPADLRFYLAVSPRFSLCPRLFRLGCLRISRGTSEISCTGLGVIWKARAPRGNRAIKKRWRCNRLGVSIESGKGIFVDRKLRILPRNSDE